MYVLVGRGEREVNRMDSNKFYGIYRAGEELFQLICNILVSGGGYQRKGVTCNDIYIDIYIYMGKKKA